MINLKIDNKDISVPQGTNVFKAAKDNGIYIPGLCYHPKLTQYGGCRLCMVEITERGRTRHRFSCAQPVAEGMTVKTKTPQTEKYTRSVMEYLLAHHPLDCPTCDKSGECGLQEVTHDLNLKAGRFKSARLDEPMRRDNPLLEYNSNRCILCSRCVKVCKEIAGVGAIDYQNRGFKTIVGTAFNKPLDCSFCGGCVSVCPTGSWQDRTLKFRARPWELKKTPTICTYCAVGCSLVINTKKNEVMRITPDKNLELGVNEGNLCVKGKFGHEFINSDKRIKTPLIKKGGKLRSVSWDAALEYISKKFSEIISDRGGNAIGGIGSEKCTNEDNYLFQKFCRAVLGTNNIDNISNMKSPSLNRLINNSVAYGMASTSLEGIENADTVFFVGADVSEAHPVVGSMVRKAIRKNKTKVIIANARNVEFGCETRNLFRINYKLGTQTALINAMIKVVVDEKLIDLKKAAAKTENFNELRASLNDPETGLKKVSKATNISEDAIREASVLIAKAENCYVICGKDIQEDPSGEQTIEALMNLCALINKGDTDKVSIVFSRVNNNSQGVNDMGVVPDYLPGYIDITDQGYRDAVEESWGMKLPDDLLGKDFGKDSGDIFDLAVKKKVRALYVMGENPVVNYPNGKKVKDAFKKAEFVVVQDSFLTETAELADVVLPSSTYVEKGGTFTNMGMTVQRLHKAIPQVGDSKPDWQIVCALAEKMGHTFPYTTSKDIVDEIGTSVPIYEGIEINRLRRKGFHWILSLYYKTKAEIYRFEITSKKAGSAVKKNRNYPFIMLTGSSLRHLGTYSRNSESLVSLASECFVEINRLDARKADIIDGDMVKIESARGKLKLKAKITGRVPEGTVFVSEDYEWVPVNSLRGDGYTNVKITKTK
ncbi:NADH dehydrogenase I chainG [Candidatus Scalindua japonica]|uniref:NADH dehydrogenase I chainG n=1 Tax=Candidatus Scalindua japonica TaxID=1284222 RepID=A0A286TU38_9BACT|nr:NADH-quinone oxidoreductase subunit NuoG [Candidatus Scalindua japonica]GAX59396.1 NADH dehydrogenase I chainG [Candidatus Scalindua japonica]